MSLYLSVHTRAAAWGSQGGVLGLSEWSTGALRVEYWYCLESWGWQPERSRAQAKLLGDGIQYRLDFLEVGSSTVQEYWKVHPDHVWLERR